MDSYRENFFSINSENKGASNQTFATDANIASKQESNFSINPSSNQENDQTSGSFISFVSSGASFPPNSEGILCNKCIDPAKAYRRQQPFNSKIYNARKTRREIHFHV